MSIRNFIKNIFTNNNDNNFDKISKIINELEKNLYLYIGLRIEEIKILLNQIEIIKNFENRINNIENINNYTRQNPDYKNQIIILFNNLKEIIFLNEKKLKILILDEEENIKSKEILNSIKLIQAFNFNENFYFKLKIKKIQELEKFEESKNKLKMLILKDLKEIDLILYLIILIILI